ncbi:MAG TPA: CNNM domain-containing protein [Pirellulaceae bacterium]|nr:CNNM domain-containing protein [Pirellulaceae bacterium]HMO91302.1 CNNM domain-containing protein [Pirellulaceae bacterium]HMP68514.1 CNNM domain-containing protein [Pirellulaceae bacterium]
MIWIALGLLLIGLFLSAFFSGSETGFFRVSRVRLVMDTIDGDPLARQLLHLSNHPQWFVATALIGNNLANYLVSMSIIVLSSLMFAGITQVGELAIALALSPLLFVYGELLPKSVYLDAPNRMLRISAPLFIFFVVLFAPISAILWLLGQLIEKLLGKSPVRVRANLARKEIQKVIEEGHQTGILQDSQRHLAHNFIEHASRSVSEVMRSMSRYPLITEHTTCENALRIAKRNNLNELPVRDSRTRKLTGYVKATDLLLAVSAADGKHAPISPLLKTLVEVSTEDKFGEALFKLQNAREPLARVVNLEGESVGLVALAALKEPLLSGPLLGMRRA